MKIKWCIYHNAEINNPRDNLCWDYEPNFPGRCASTPMRLIPDNALPTVEELRQALIVHENEIFVDSVIVATLQALTALDGETP